MKLSNLKISVFIACVMLFAISCSSDDPEDRVIVAPATGSYSNGLFILNEGGFGSSNASVTFVDETGETFNDIFTTVNERNLGDVAQSMGFNEQEAYIVVNNSSTIEVVDRNTFEEIATVTTLISNPRFIAFNNNVGYVTNWGDPFDTTDDYVAVLNLETNLVESFIPVAEGPERMVVHNNNLYVAHKGGFGFGDTVTIINLDTQSVSTIINVGDVPDAMQLVNGSLYVLCSGKPAFTEDETLGQLFKINPETNVIENTLTFPEGVHPSFLQFDNGSLYYTLNGNVFEINTNNFQLPTTPFINPSNDGLQVVYGFNVINSKIFVTDAKDFASNGAVFVYNNQGMLEEQVTAQINPNAVYLNN